MSQAYLAPDFEWAQSQIEQYREIFPRYGLYAETLRRLLEAAAKKHAPLAIVQARPKAIASFAEKIQRKREKYRDPVHQFTDLCGGRVIAHTPDEVRAMCDFIEKNFIIDWDNTIDVSQRLKPTEFGYRSVHYIVQFKPGIFPNATVSQEIPEAVFGLKAEIQVRTILEHAWADFNHRLVYKSPFPIPTKWQREFAGLAAMLERADTDFAAIETGFRAYVTNYGTYMSPEQMRNEIALLELVMACDPDNVELAHRIGKLAIAMGDWPKAIAVFSRYVDTGYQPILRDLGIALCKLHGAAPDSPAYQQGQRYLERASTPEYRDSDALASLASTWKQSDPDRARDLYRQAFEANPKDPYALGQYLEYEIAHQHDIRLATMLRPVIEDAIERCRERAEVGVDLPWALYNIGKFCLLLGRPHDSLRAYIKAVQLTTDDWMVATSLQSLDRLAVVGDKLPGLTWAQRFLLLVRASRFNVAEARQQLAALASPGGAPIRGPVALVAGGCDAREEALLQGYRTLLVNAFAGFTGTIISGGTRAGVAGLTGDVQQSYPGTIHTVGYVPRRFPADVQMDDRYGEIRRTDGDDFSPLEPLQYWTDLIASDICPCDVKLIGMSGGAIAASEYRMALALRARVAIIEDSGRAAAKLLTDEDWRSSPLLLHLPAEGQIIAEFIQPSSTQLAEEEREAVAQAIHAAYCAAEADLLQSEDPSLAQWDDLLDYLKESNRQQADHILEKLRLIGCRAVPVAGRPVSPIEFTEAEVETLARAEHARWVIERVRDGWTLGARRDILRKTSPYLVPWIELPAKIKASNRSLIRQIPDFLARVQMEIQRGCQEEEA